MLKVSQESHYMSDLPEALPSKARTVYECFLAMPTLSKQALSSTIDRYLVSLGTASGENRLADLEKAQAIGAALKTLIEQCTEPEMPHVQAAAYYLINDEDAKPDLDSVLGFDDDAEVFNAVAEMLGHPELAVHD